MKKERSLILLETLLPIAEENKSVILPVKCKDNLCFRDRQYYECYFKVIKQNQNAFEIEFKPTNELISGSHKTTANIDNVKSHFKSWIELIKRYNNTKTVFDNQFDEQSQREFEQFFNLQDEDAETSAFNFQQQLFLHDYINYCLDELNKEKDNISAEDFENINQSFLLLQKEIPRLSKRLFLEQLSSTLVKVKNSGIQLVTKMFKTLFSKVVEKGIEFVLNPTSMTGLKQLFE